MQLAFARTRSLPSCLQGQLAQTALWEASADSEASPEKAGGSFSRHTPSNSFARKPYWRLPPFLGSSFEDDALQHVPTWVTLQLHCSHAPLGFGARPNGLLSWPDLGCVLSPRTCLMIAGLCLNLGIVSEPDPDHDLIWKCLLQIPILMTTNWMTLDSHIMEGIYIGRSVLNVLN